MTMTKGKKQESDGIDCDLPLRSSTFMSDDEYVQVGSVLRKVDAGSDVVMVDPCERAQGRLTISQTPLGRMPRSLLTAFGLHEAVFDFFLREARPRCAHCAVPTTRSESLDRAHWPKDGYVAVVVDGVEESLSLEEQCELLDVERAVIDGMLIRKDDIAGREGDPVLTIASTSDRESVSTEIDRWFSRGGGALRLMRYPSRSERGVELQKIFRGWRCPSCGGSHALASRQLLEDAPPCQRCRGEGWLVVEDERLVACEDCDAFGRSTPLARYEVAGTLLKDAAQLTFQRMKESVLLSQDVEFTDLRSRLAALCDEGLAQYPIGTPISLLSTGERVLATIASARLSSLSDVELIVDGGGLGASSVWMDSLTRRNHPPRLRVLRPNSAAAEVVERSRSAERVITLREVVIGPLSIPTLSLDVGGLTVIQGEPGVGKSLLLKEISRRFSKRKKLAHLGSFGDLKRCYHIQVDSCESETVMGLLGISPRIAEQAARTRHARERGLSKDDFLPSRSRHRCDLCKGVPTLESDRCSQCDGSLFDRLVGDVVVNNVSFADLMRSSLARTAAVLWADDELIAVLDRVPEDLKTSLSLGGAARGLAPALRRFLSPLSAFGSILARKGALDGELVLVDAPFGTTASYQRVLIQCIKDLRSRGATIVCAGVPETLENIFSSVVRLRFVAEPQRDQGANRFLDIRMTRKSEVVLER